LRKLVLYPFLFAVFPIVYLYSRNTFEISASDLIFPILITLGGSLIIFFGFKLVTRSYHKSALVTCFIVFLFYVFGALRDLVITAASSSGNVYRVSFYLGLLWVVLSVAVFVAVFRSRLKFSAVTRFLNLLALFLVLISLVNIGVFAVRDGARNHVRAENLNISNRPAGDLPDIYYIILDEYAREDTLREIYNYDNSEFLKFLEDKGFIVAGQSRSNYQRTLLCVGSTLKMDYLTDEERVNDGLLLDMIENSVVADLLKSKGYHMVHIASSYDFKGINRYMEVLPPHKVGFGVKMSNLAYYLVQSTALSPFASLFGDHGREAILNAFEELTKIPEREGPTFVFAHILCPHQPFIFDREGDPVPMNIFEAEGNVAQHYRKGYPEQLLFVNRKTEETINAILAKSKVKPIIILQGDTGPQPVGQGDTRELTKWINIHERLNIFNSYLLPGDNTGLLYESVTPVNSFRILFNMYFNADYEILPDKSYYPDSHAPSGFILVPPE
jgi:hypothetical protein